MQVVVVVVLYKTTVEDSATMQSLEHELVRSPSLLNNIKLVVWDNSPDALVANAMPAGFEYVHSRTNSGVSGAYNNALQLAKELACPWLLLLDQDTSLPPRYLERMLEYSRTVGADARIATVVPLVRSQGNPVSPRRAGWTLRSSQITGQRSKTIETNVFAINSGTLMRVAALDSVGGYSSIFWLDLSDQYVFRMFYEYGYVTFLAADLTVEHSIANSDYDRSMSPERYSSYLAAENIFTRQFHSALSNGAHNLLLLARATRQYRRFQNKEFARLTLRSFWQRISLSKSHALRIWRGELGERNMPLVGRQEAAT